MSSKPTDSSTLQLPARAPKHICQGLLALLIADESDKLDQRRIDELTYGANGTRSSNTDAKRFLEDLALISADLTIVPDALEHRHDSIRLKSLLKQRLRNVLLRHGCEPSEIKFLDDPTLSERGVKNAVRALSLFSHVHDPYNRIRGALTTLHKIMVGVVDAATLRKEFDSRSGSRGDVTATSTDESRQDVSALLQKIDEVAVTGKRFPMRMSQSGTITHWMHVYFDVPPSRESWAALAELAAEESRSLTH